MKNIWVYSIVFAGLLAACGGREPVRVPHSEKSLVAIDSFEIETGFQPMPVWSGFVESQGQDYLYLANLLVHDSLHFYTWPGLQKYRSIPLGKVMSTGYELYNIQVSGPDSVMFMGRYHNILFSIDGRGDIVSKRDLSA